MKPPRGAPHPDPVPDEHLEDECDTRPSHPMDLDVGNPELDAWLAAREIELEEMAWALVDQFNEDWRP